MAFLLISGAALSNWRGSGFHADGPEMPRLRETLGLKSGMSVADVGAGNGDLTVALAAEVGPGGRVYANDLDLAQVRSVVAVAALSNVTFVQSQTGDTALPENCCDAIVVRRVYHHLTESAAINASMLRALRPGGVLAVIDFPPLVSWLWALNHGVEARRVVDEVVAIGFQLERVIEDWPGRGPLESYCALFIKERQARQ
ncbi:MAG: class I SAM-dependent methyltransferase [Vicinamibacterales bacterium]